VAYSQKFGTEQGWFEYAILLTSPSRTVATDAYTERKQCQQSLLAEHGPWRQCLQS
jgi:hypothetical protein